MKIKGFQELTLIDYPGKVACTVFLHGCNFKCGFCHNPELVIYNEGDEYDSEEIINFLRARKKYLDGICITGGEPLLTVDKNFLKEVKKIGYKIKIDTNGSFPEKLNEMIDEKLVDYIAMDIKSSKERYNEVTSSEVDISKIEESIKMMSKLGDYEFRTTILEDLHSAEEFENLCEWVYSVIGKKAGRFSLQGFKKEDKIIDKTFLKKQDTKKEYLDELKKIADNYFEEVLIKV
jgi:pyruvate formate lyase activating enzyme